MTVFLFIFLLLLLTYTVVMNRYRRSWNSLPEFSGPTASTSSTNSQRPENTVISVIVPVRNEEHRIQTLASSLLAQQLNSGSYEIIMVDDHSDDGTWFQLQQLSSLYREIKSVRLPSDIIGKKKAIEAGINIAAGELIVTTDADCTFPAHWLETLFQFYRKHNAVFIAAPVKMTAPDSLLEIFQKLDFMCMQGITGAAVHSRLHCMCNGANLAYMRKGFHEVNGFDGIDHIPSGDDMLLMYKMFKLDPDSVLFLKSREAIVTTLAEPTWKRFFSQRIRWASKTIHYEDKKIILALALTYVVNLCFVVLGVAAIVTSSWLWILLLLLLMKVLAEFPFVNSVASFFGERRLLIFFPLYQPLHILYIVLSGFFGTFGSYNWKSRTIRNNGRHQLLKQ